MEMMEILIRTLILFIVLYILARILSKKLISHMTFFDFVAGITLGSMTANLIFMQNITVIMGVSALTAFAFYALLSDVLSLKSLKLRKILNSEPTILMQEGKILKENLRKVRINIDELLTHLRKNGVFYIEEVNTAILETDGTVSILKKAPKHFATRENINVAIPDRGIAQPFIIDGKVLSSRLTVIGKNKEWVNDILHQIGSGPVKDVMLAQIDKKGNVYIDTEEATFFQNIND